jgi:SAM-dependent methyltransferase
MLQLDRHSLSILNALRGYDSFLDSLTTVCDMGCGSGEDITWWATLESLDDSPEPYNYKCYAVDQNGSKLSSVPDLANIIKSNKDFTDADIIPASIDLLWSHDSLQYSTNPIETLKFWNKQMTVNGMLIVSVPQHSGVEYNRYYSRTFSSCYYHYTPTNLIYMLATNGFDCRDAYLLKQFGDTWLTMAVYKSDVEPMDPKTTSWFDLIDKKLLHPTVEASIVKNGFLRQEEIIYPWLDGNKYFIDWIPQRTEIPAEAGEPTVSGVFNTTTASTATTIEQAPKAVKETQLLKPVGIMRPPKQKYVK